jgi:hypothetical protein
MIVPLAGSPDWGPLTGLLFFAGALLIGLGGALLWFSRRWAAVAFALGAMPMGASLPGQLPAIAGRPALRISVTHIACTPWTRAVAGRMSPRCWARTSSRAGAGAMSASCSY